MKSVTRLSLRSATLFVVALVSVLLTIPASAQNVVSGSNGKIAFDRDGKKGQNNIWVMNPDGSG